MEAIAEPVPRQSISEADTWDLTPLYSSDQKWQDDFKQLEQRIPEYDKLKGTLGASAASLRACLKFDLEVSRKLEALHTYAHLKNDEDKTNSLYQGNYEQMMNLVTRVSQARSFIESELMTIPENRMNEFMRDEELEFYRFHLEQKLRFRPHTLSYKEESLLASATQMSRASQEAFGMLDNADLKLGSVEDENGKGITITHGNFQSLLQSYDRRLRKDTFDVFYTAYKDHRYTYASLLGSSIKKDIFYSRARNYPSVREQALFQENIPLEVYDNLIETVHQNLEPLYQYFAIRKKILQLDELHVYDCSVPLVKDIRWNVGYAEAVETISAALQPLGDHYISALQTGLNEERWVDRYENIGKRSGAYSSGCYDSPPYILLNYRDDNINSVYTLAHEAGHSMHSFKSRASQKYLYADYTIFVAEVASTFNEALLTRHLLKERTDKEMQIYLICREIDNFRGTLYRQTMFAEFEREIYRAAEQGEPLTVEFFTSTYLKLLRLYFGPGVVLDEALELECFRIPHFYFSFYVYKYATGIAAAYSLADRVTEGGEAELNAYLNFLESGGSQYPIDLLKGAGVDMTSPLPVQTALDTFAALVNQLETLTA